MLPRPQWSAISSMVSVLTPDLPATKVGKIDKKALRADIGRRLADDRMVP